MKFKKTSITLMAAAAVFMVSVEAVGQRRGGGSRGGGSRGGGSRGGSINRTPSMSRPQTPRPNISRPSVQKPSGQRPSGQRPSGQRPNVKPPQRPSTLPNKGRPSGGFPNKGISPNTRPSVLRPSSKPSTLPGFPSSGKRPSVGGFDPSKITNSVKNRYPSGSQKPFMPDWYKPGASQLPSGGVTKPATRPGTGIRPPATNLPAKPGIRPPATNLPAKPGIRPPGYRPPGYRPPGYRPPGYRPPCLSTAGLPTRLASLVSAWLHLSTRILVATGNRRCSFLLVRLGRSSRILQLWKWRDGLLRRRYGLCKRRGQWHCE